MDDVSDIMTEVHREDAACRRIIDVLDTSGLPPRFMMPLGYNPDR